MHKNKALSLSVVALLMANAAWTQISPVREPNSGKLNSPYSRFGIGNLSDNRSVSLRGMGGISNGFVSKHQINAQNPASYAHLTTTAFELGIEAQTNNVKMQGNTTNSSTFTLNHLNFAVPLVKGKLAMNLGYSPYSKVYYNAIDSIDNVNGTGLRADNRYNGDGGLNYGFIGLGGGYKGLSVGVNVGYLFGSIRNSSYWSLSDTPYSYQSRVTEVSEKNVYGGLMLKSGILYKHDFKDKKYLSIGATATIANNVNMTRDRYEIGGNSSSGGDPVTDTVSALYSAKGKLELPTEMGFGIHFGKESNYNIGVDVNYAKWENFKKFDGTADAAVGKESYRVALGGEIIPNSKASAKQYLSHITYRLGGYYGRDYLFLKNTPIDYYGVTLGAQLPLRANNLEQMGAFNFSLDLGNRGTVNNDLAREFFVKFTVGFKLNARWFERYKY